MTNLRFSKTIITCALTVTSTVLFSLPGYAQSDARLSSEAATARIYAKEAMIDRWRRGEPGLALPVIMSRVAAKSLEGVSRRELVDMSTSLTSEFRRVESAALENNWNVDENYKMVVGHLGAVAGVAIEAGTKLPTGGSTAGSAIADFSVTGYESLVRSQEVQKASQQLGARVTSVRASEEGLAELVFRAFEISPAFREVYDEQFLPRVGFKPGDGIDEVSAGHPEFAALSTVQQTLERLRAIEARDINDAEKMDGLRALVVDHLTTLQTENAESFNRMAESDEAILEYTRTAEITARKVAESQRRKEQERVRTAGLRSGAYLASQVIGIFDEKASREIGAVMTTALDVRDAVMAFEAAKALGGVDGFASLALSGSLVESALGLISAFKVGGPSGDELILRAIAQIREDIQNLRVEMHDRFDIVDSKLDAIYDRLDAGLRGLEVQLRSNDRVLTSIQNALEEVAIAQVTASSLLMARTELILLHVNRDQDICPEYIELRGIENYEPPTATIVDCYLDLRAFLTPRYLHASQLTPGEELSSRDYISMLRDASDEVANAALENFRSVPGPSTTGLPTSIGGPADWAYAAERYLRFVVSWPEHFEHISADYEAMISEGSKIRRGIDEIQEGFKDFAARKESPRLDALIQRLAAQKAILESEIRRFEQEFYDDDPNLPDLNLIDADIPMGLNTVEFTVYEDKYYNDRHALSGNDFPHGLNRIPLPRIMREAETLGLGEFFVKARAYFALNSVTNEVIGGCGWSNNDGTPLAGAIEFCTRHYPGPLTFRLQVIFRPKEGLCTTFVSNESTQRTFRNSVNLEEIRLQHDPISNSDLDRYWRGKLQADFMDRLEEQGDLVETPTSDIWDFDNCIAKELRPAIDAALTEKTNLLEGYIEDQLRDSLAIINANLEIELDSALLSYWLWMGYSDARLRSDHVAALISGGVRPPTIDSSIQEVAEAGLPPWEAPRHYAESLMEFVEILRSHPVSSILEEPGDSFGIRAILDRIPDQ